MRTYVCVCLCVCVCACACLCVWCAYLSAAVGRVQGALWEACVCVVGLVGDDVGPLEGRQTLCIQQRAVCLGLGTEGQQHRDGFTKQTNKAEQQ